MDNSWLRPPGNRASSFSFTGPVTASAFPNGMNAVHNLLPDDMCIRRHSLPGSHSLQVPQSSGSSACSSVLLCQEDLGSDKSDAESCPADTRAASEPVLGPRQFLHQRSQPNDLSRFGRDVACHSSASQPVMQAPPPPLAVPTCITLPPTRVSQRRQAAHRRSTSLTNSQIDHIVATPSVAPAQQPPQQSYLIRAVPAHRSSMFHSSGLHGSHNNNSNTTATTHNRSNNDNGNIDENPVGGTPASLGMSSPPSQRRRTISGTTSEADTSVPMPRNIVANFAVAAAALPAAAAADGTSVHHAANPSPRRPPVRVARRRNSYSSLGGGDAELASCVSTQSHMDHESSGSVASRLGRLTSELAAAHLASEKALAVVAVAPAPKAAAGLVQPAAPRPGDVAVGLLYDEAMELHVGPMHFEQPARVVRLLQELRHEGLEQRAWRIGARKATDAELLTVHSMEHIKNVDSLFDARPEEQRDLAFIPHGNDLYVCGATAEAARFASGCCVEAVQQVLAGTVLRSLAVVRPPGHHAECERAMGFCFFNNCAVAAMAALQYRGVQRVVILDWDVHHGNGIQNVLNSNPNALYISIHRDPSKFYPFVSGFVNEVGTGEGRGFNINIPWYRKGATDADYEAAFDLVVQPVLTAYKPDLIIVAAGFDAAEGDPLGGCKMTPEGYALLTRRLMRFAGGRVVLALEGGYNTGITAECAAACVRALLGEAAPAVAAGDRVWPSGEVAGKTLRDVFTVQREFWPCLADRSFDELWDAYLQTFSAGQ